MLLRTLRRASRVSTAALATAAQPRRAHRAAAGYGIAAGVAITATTIATATAESEKNRSWTSPTAWYQWFNGTSTAGSADNASAAAGKLTFAPINKPLLTLTRLLQIFFLLLSIFFTY